MARMKKLVLEVWIYDEEPGDIDPATLSRVYLTDMAKQCEVALQENGFRVDNKKLVEVEFKKEDMRGEQ